MESPTAVDSGSGLSLQPIEGRQPDASSLPSPLRVTSSRLLSAHRAAKALSASISGLRPVNLTEPTAQLGPAQVQSPVANVAQQLPATADPQPPVIQSHQQPQHHSVVPPEQQTDEQATPRANERKGAEKGSEIGDMLKVSASPCSA